jgi:trimethylamine--corrinoid protein Co-methyltransferase
MPKYLDRRVREDWKERGGSDLYERARTAALEIIESHKPEPLDPDAAKQIRAIVEAADRERGVA